MSLIFSWCPEWQFVISIIFKLFFWDRITFHSQKMTSITYICESCKCKRSFFTLFWIILHHSTPLGPTQSSILALFSRSWIVLFQRQQHYFSCIFLEFDIHFHRVSFEKKSEAFPLYTLFLVDLNLLACIRDFWIFDFLMTSGRFCDVDLWRQLLSGCTVELFLKNWTHILYCLNKWNLMFCK